MNCAPATAGSRVMSGGPVRSRLPSPGTPHPVSGEGCPPDTGVLLQAWHDDSMGFADRAIVDEVSRG